jgi:hypothetical protein
MTTSLHTRVRRLEDAVGGGGECPRCSGTTVIIANGNLKSLNRNRQKFTLEEAEEFVDEEEDGRCPVCGAGRQTGTVGGWGN